MAKNIIFAIEDATLGNDLEVAFTMYPGSIGYDLQVVSDIETLEFMAKSSKPDLIVVSYDMLSGKEEWTNDGKTAYHATNQRDYTLGASYGLPSIGISDDPDEILDLLKKDPQDVPDGIKKQEKKETQKKNDPSQKKENIKKENTKKENTKKENVKTQESAKNKGVPQQSGLEVLDEDEGLLDKIDDMLLNEPKEPVAENTGETETKDVIDREFKKDMIKTEESKAKVVTVYSAKGGVGKTTIASELAVYLSLVSTGSRKLRVCLVDYNIDFGDVRSTLAVPSNSPNLSYWTEEIQEFLDKGKKPSEIMYSKSDIEEFLYHDKKASSSEDTGLYILPAPLTNEDSMEVRSESLKIILDNLIKNGGFDFIVCDTGNNTRDSTMLALQAADIILLIMTQNVNTANCDKAFMDTMATIDFDLSHTKLIINNIMPHRATGISVQEILDFFPFDCIAKIKFDTDVIKATNLGEPLAYHADHDFTKQFRNISAYVLQDREFETDTKVKKKKWYQIFKKQQ